MGLPLARRLHEPAPVGSLRILASALGCGAILLSAPGAVRLAARNDPPLPAPRIHLADRAARTAVEKAVRGAVSRLSRPACLAVFSDFTDETGRTLRLNLGASKQSAAQYLIERLWFVDGSDEPQCLDAPATVAFTAVGDELIRVCATRFASRFAHQRTAGEILIIHELLHALGLAENPPSSAEITRQVAKRCGNG